MTVEHIAEIVHEANRAYCRTLGDTSQPAWADAPDWQKQSAINGVTAHLNSPSPLHPSDSHVLWLKEKTEQGWVYGPVKDVAKKEHPCCVPYDELPEEQKFKDSLFGSIVRCCIPFVKE